MCIKISWIYRIDKVVLNIWHDIGSETRPNKTVNAPEERKSPFGAWVR